MSEKPDDYEVEVIVKDNKIIVIGRIRPIYLCVGDWLNEKDKHIGWKAL